MPSLHKHSSPLSERPELRVSVLTPSKWEDWFHKFDKAVSWGTSLSISFLLMLITLQLAFHDGDWALETWLLQYEVWFFCLCPAWLVEAVLALVKPTLTRVLSWSPTLEVKSITSVKAVVAQYTAHSAWRGSNEGFRFSLSFMNVVCKKSSNFQSAIRTVYGNNFQHF